ncbi:MAG: hypothetical protein IJR43_03510 [Synergistaceae bacterium]|nr:hypothetical protein [Synergistaceae bacterium]
MKKNKKKYIKKTKMKTLDWITKILNTLMNLKLFRIILRIFAFLKVILTVIMFRRFRKMHKNSKKNQDKK